MRQLFMNVAETVKANWPHFRTHNHFFDTTQKHISGKVTYDMFLPLSCRHRVEVSVIAYKQTMLLETEFLEFLHTEIHIPATVVLWMSFVQLNTLIF
jgi:hypothetical protein